MGEEPRGLNIEELIEGAMHDVSLETFMDAAVPLDYAEELARAIRGPAIRAVLEARLEQIVKHGHDREHDALLSIVRLPDLAIEVARIARSRIGVTGADRNLPAARRGLARAAAICLAAIDRIDMTKEGGNAA